MVSIAHAHHEAQIAVSLQNGLTLVANPEVAVD